jgi:2-oxoglutarate ferredoxin oxidoreductase subunit alpha
VSSFQLHFADHDILTPGDDPNVLVAMNPAALKANIADVPARRRSRRQYRRVHQTGDAEGRLRSLPAGGRLAGRLFRASGAADGGEELKEFDLSRKEAERSKNKFALGPLSWMYYRPTAGTSGS